MDYPDIPKPLHEEEKVLIESDLDPEEEKQKRLLVENWHQVYLDLASFDLKVCLPAKEKQRGL